MINFFLQSIMFIVLLFYLLIQIDLNFILIEFNVDIVSFKEFDSNITKNPHLFSNYRLNASLVLNTEEETKLNYNQEVQNKIDFLIYTMHRHELTEQEYKDRGINSLDKCAVVYTKDDLTNIYTNSKEIKLLPFISEEDSSMFDESNLELKDSTISYFVDIPFTEIISSEILIRSVSIDSKVNLCRINSETMYIDSKEDPYAQFSEFNQNIKILILNVKNISKLDFSEYNKNLLNEDYELDKNEDFCPAALLLFKFLFFTGMIYSLDIIWIENSCILNITDLNILIHKFLENEKLNYIHIYNFRALENLNENCRTNQKSLVSNEFNLHEERKEIDDIDIDSSKINIPRSKLHIIGAQIENETTINFKNLLKWKKAYAEKICKKLRTLKTFQHNRLRNQKTQRCKKQNSKKSCKNCIIDKAWGLTNLYNSKEYKEETISESYDDIASYENKIAQLKRQIFKDMFKKK